MKFIENRKGFEIFGRTKMMFKNGIEKSIKKKRKEIMYKFFNISLKYYFKKILFFFIDFSIPFLIISFVLPKIS